jgi:hypothetical protein
LFRITELRRIFTILSFFAFLLDANNHSTITPQSPTKNVLWRLTHGLNLVPHNHIPANSEDLHLRPHISLGQSLGRLTVFVTDCTQELLLQSWNTINM